MEKKLKILLAQLNPIGGDVKGNYRKLEDAWKRACGSKIDIIALPEMFLSGYPIDDLVLRDDFISSIYSTEFQLGEWSKGKYFEVFNVLMLKKMCCCFKFC